MSLECTCKSGDDFCPRYNRAMGRYWQFCQGTSGLGRAKEEAYLGALAKTPGIASQLLGFGKALLDHALAGLPQVADATYQERLAVCQACPLLSAGKCIRCGCEIALKARWSEQKCPEMKWPGDQPGGCGCGS